MKKKKRTLRRHVAEKRAPMKSKSDILERIDSRNSKDSLTSTPASWTGSFLRNKLDNPLFKPLFSRKNRSYPGVTRVFEDSDSEDEDSCSESEEDSVSEVSNIEAQHRWRLFRNNRRQSLTKRLGDSLFTKRHRKLPKSKLRLQRRISSSSSNSSASTATDVEVETLNKLEDENMNVNNTTSKGHLLYTHKGQAVRVQFNYDYLLISPVIHKLSLSRQRLTPKTIYYENLALWTNNDDCLRLIHMKNKDTKLQERAEIKLFLSKKKKTVTIQQLSNELKDKISVLMTSKLNIDVNSAKKMLEQKNTTKDVNRVVKQIDRATEKSLAQNFSTDFQDISSLALVTL